MLDTRLSNTATHADHWLAPVPGSEAAILLAIANHLIRTRPLRPRVRPPLVELAGVPGREHPDRAADVRGVRARCSASSTPGTPSSWPSASPASARRRSREVAEIVAGAGHAPRHARLALGRRRQPRRLAGRARALPAERAARRGRRRGRHVPERVEQVRAAADPRLPGHPAQWNELTWPDEYPLAMNEMSFLLPHLLKDGRGTLDVYFTRVYNPVWTNPDGFSWIETLTDESLVGLHVALTPDLERDRVLRRLRPADGARLRAPRHPLATSSTTASGSASASRCCAPRASGSARPIADTREVNPGEVWEENEFWIELSWRIDPDGVARHPPLLRVAGAARREAHRRRVLPLDLRALGAGAARAGRRRGPHPARVHAPLRRVRGRARRRAAARAGGARRTSSTTSRSARFGRVYTRAPKPDAAERRARCRRPTPTRRAGGRSASRSTGAILRGFPTPSGRLEFYSRTLAEWGWPEAARARRTCAATSTPTSSSPDRWC